MGNAKRQGKSEKRTGARAAVLKSFADNPANPCARALVLLGCNGSMQRQRDAFDGRATDWQIIDWRNGRRGLPTWAVELLREKLERKRQQLAHAGSELEPGPGLGWNKHATRGLGEWRAQRNLEKR